MTRPSSERVPSERHREINLTDGVLDVHRLSG
jgi:hypothetical protein